MEILEQCVKSSKATKKTVFIVNLDRLFLLFQTLFWLSILDFKQVNADWVAIFRTPLDSF